MQPAWLRDTSRSITMSGQDIRSSGFRPGHYGSWHHRLRSGEPAENPDTSVLVLEAAGRERNFLFHWLAGFARMAKGSYRWGRSTAFQKYMKGGHMQAKAVGGGSAINAQVYMRGNRNDYDSGVMSTGGTVGAFGRYCRISSARKTTSTSPTTITGRRPDWGPDAARSAARL